MIQWNYQPITMPWSWLVTSWLVLTSATFVHLHPHHNKTRILAMKNREIIAPQEIIFPDSFEVSFEPLPRLGGTTPKCAESSSFCEDFEGYPFQRLKDLLDKQAQYKELFRTEEAPKEIANRLGSDPEQYFCKSIQKTVFPKVARNSHNEWKLVINLGVQEGFQQGVTVETCRMPNSECDLVADALPYGYRTSCKQKYIYRRLLSLSDNGRPVPDTFPLPSACCCSYRKDIQFLVEPH